MHGFLVRALHIWTRGGCIHVAAGCRAEQAAELSDDTAGDVRMQPISFYSFPSPPATLMYRLYDLIFPCLLTLLNSGATSCHDDSSALIPLFPGPCFDP